MANTPSKPPFLSLPARAEPPRVLAFFVLGYLALNLLGVLAEVIVALQGDSYTRIVTSLDKTILFGFLAVAILEGRRRLTLTFLVLSTLAILGACGLYLMNISLGERWFDIGISAVLVIILLLPSSSRWYSLKTTQVRNGTPWRKPASIAVALGWYLLTIALYLSFASLVVDFIKLGIHFIWLVATFLLASTAHLYARQIHSLVRLTRVQFGSTPIVLLVREFNSDQAAGGTERAPKLLPLAFQEETIAKAVAHLGTLVTIAKPTERLPSLGGLRVKASHEQWKGVVEYLAQSSSFLIVRLPVSLTPGIKWEVENVIKCFSAERILLLVPNDLVVQELLKDQFPHFSDSVITSSTSAIRLKSDKQALIGLIGFDKIRGGFFVPFPRGQFSALWRNDLTTALKSALPSAVPTKSAT